MPLSNEIRASLLTLARQAVAAEVGVLGAMPAVEPAKVLAEKRGCFVTLTQGGRLRGCIGTFQPRTPLAETIVEMGRSAARDPRFVDDPITPAELDTLDVEVSILSPLEKTDHPEQLELGIHGIYIVAGHQAGCFLPEVATDYNMSVEQFLDTCCQHKAHLPAGAWRNPTTDVFLFTSEKFGD